MPQTNEGVLLLIGALFLLLGLLGGGFEISAIKIPPVGKYTRAFAFVIGSIVFGLGVMRLVFPTPTPAPAVAQITAPPPPTAAQTIAPPSPLPPTQTPAPSPVNTTVPPTALPPTAAPTLPPAQTSTALAALIQNVSVEYDQTRFEKTGMVIHVQFSVSGMQNQEGRATAYFSQRNGEALQDKNGEYTATDGQVAASATFTPGYPSTQYDNLEIFVPYDELELGPGKYELQFHVEIWEKAHPEKPALAVSPDIDFDFAK